MAYLTVDVDLDDIESCDFIKELKRRIDCKWNMFTGNEIKEMKTFFKIPIAPTMKDVVKTLSDEMKMKAIIENFDSFTEAEFLNFLTTK